MRETQGLDATVESLVVKNFDLIPGQKCDRRVPFGVRKITSNQSMRVEIDGTIENNVSELLFKSCSPILVLPTIGNRPFRDDKEYVIRPLATLAHHIYRIFPSDFLRRTLKADLEGLYYEHVGYHEAVGGDWIQTIDEGVVPTFHNDVIETAHRRSLALWDEQGAGTPIVGDLSYAAVDALRNYVLQHRNDSINALALCELWNGLPIPVIDLRDFFWDEHEIDTHLADDEDLILDGATSRAYITVDLGDSPSVYLNGSDTPVTFDHEFRVHLNAQTRFGSRKRTLRSTLAGLHLPLFEGKGERIEADYARFKGKAPGISRDDGLITPAYKGRVCEQVHGGGFGMFRTVPEMPERRIKDMFTNDEVPTFKVQFSYSGDRYTPKIWLPPEYGQELNF